MRGRYLKWPVPFPRWSQHSGARYNRKQLWCTSMGPLRYPIRSSSWSIKSARTSFGVTILKCGAAGLTSLCQNWFWPAPMHISVIGSILVISYVTMNIGPILFPLLEINEKVYTIIFSNSNQIQCFSSGFPSFFYP